jgi:hypothetical protein
MGLKGKRGKHLTKAGSDSLLEAKRSHAAAREHRVAELQQRLASQYRGVHGLAEHVEIPPSDQALLSASASALLEIELTTARLAAGRAHAKALKSLGFARSELRRSLRALGMVGDSGEQREDANAPPRGATEDERCEWSRKYVEGALAEAAAK